MTHHILTHQQDGILRIQFNRPEKKNAITLAMYEAMTAALGQAEADPQVRVVLFTGSDDCYTAGNDLKDFLESPPTGRDSPVFRFLKALIAAEKPVMAAVQGIAVGIGTTMLLHCDLVYAGATARFQFPFVNLALTPEAGSSLLLPQLVGHRRAAELLMLGEMFDAETARTLGLVNAVYPPEALADAAWQVARRLAAKPPASVRLTKRLLKRAVLPALEEAMAEEGKHFLTRLRSEEAREAMQAILERRAPDFSRFS
ncbi:MAG: enoyl-CoA hydratase [Caldilineales bacterium]|nr:enoyl-CoA hydratase [Caldilineales bacterium]